MATAKEKAEANQAVENVKAAEQKVADIQAERAKKEAEKDAETLAKHPKIGSKLNWVRHNKWKLVGTAATGGAFALGWFGHKIYSDAKAAKVETPEEAEAIDEVVETPFDA